MSTDDLTLEILTEIRTEVRATNTRLDATNTRLDATDTRLDRIETGLGALRADLTRELGAFEMRQATRVNEQTAATRAFTRRSPGSSSYATVSNGASTTSQRFETAWE